MAGSTAVLVLTLWVVGWLAVVSGRQNVTIQNRMERGRHIVLHCRSKDNDLGVHRVSDGEDYAWEFWTNFWGTTLFYCDVWLEWKPKYQAHFNAYDSKDWKLGDGYQTTWKVDEHAIYLLDQRTNKWMVKHEWPQNY